MAKIREIENGEGEFAFFICQIRHFAMPPSDPVTVKLDTAADRKTKQSITQVKKCRRKLVMCITAVIMLRALTYALTYCNCMK